ncbi:MAG: hypothetical protein Q4Q06_06845 [Bacteroidota bacterium]|nr:hypothetical protein [Bacteroidota bacterium]
MKKLFLLLALALSPLMFWSCDEDDTLDSLTGYVKFTLEGQSYDYTGAVSTTTGGKFVITTGSSQGAVALSLEGSQTGTYQLGIGSDITSVTSFISGGLSYDNLSNTLVFYPFDGEKYVIIGGSCTITSSGSKVKGTFSGVAVPWDDITNLDASTLLSIVTGSNNISGSFVAYKL